MNKDYYTTLGVSKGAKDDEIKKAYRKLAHQYHPDKKGGDEAKFKEINEAYQVLGDKQKRAQYDQFGSASNNARQNASAGGSGFGGFDFSQFSQHQGGFGFEDIFSDFFGGQGGRHGFSQERGKDVQIDIEIDFFDQARGVEKKARLYKRTECVSCHGTGGDKGAKEEVCSTCSGSGQVRRVQQTFLGSFAQVAVCESCHGKGKKWSKSCQECGGDGRVKEEEEITLNIPAGVAHGQTVSFAGKGEAGAYGAPSGNLYARIHVRAHKHFERRGDDLICKEYITFSQAALGDIITLETIDGEITMKVPAATQSGEVFRIKEKGFPVVNSTQRGNHLVTIIVETPKKLNKKQRQLVQELQESGL